MSSKPGTWTLAAVDHFSSWDEHEAAVQMATRHWQWLLGRIEYSEEVYVRKLERARRSLGDKLVDVACWGLA